MSRRTLPALAAYLALALLALAFIAPILLMLAGSLKPNDRVLAEAGRLAALLPADASLHNYADVFNRVDFLGYLGNSLWITGWVVGAGLVVNALAGYAFARLEWRGRDLAFAMVLMVMIVPLEAIAVPLFYLVSRLGWRDTYMVQILPFVANAFSIYLFHTYFQGLPRALEEAARLDGAGPFKTFLLVIVPNAKPAFASVAILTFLTQWGAFLWPLMVTSGAAVRPLPLGLATFYTLPPLQWGDIFAFGTLMVAPVLLAFLLFQRSFVRGVAASGLKG